MILYNHKLRKRKEKEADNLVNTKLLKAKLKEKDLTQEDVARKIGINPSTFNRKINNEDGETMTVKEANDLSIILEIPRKQLTTIFFAKELAETQETK